MRNRNVSGRRFCKDLAGRLDGVLPIRIELPEGKQPEGTTASDGTMVQIIKASIGGSPAMVVFQQRIRRLRGYRITLCAE